MAAMDDADILRSTPERINFYRLTTLLIVGGTDIMRQVFDNIHPPRTLAAVLAAVRTTIQRTAKLSRPQMESLYPSTAGATVRSRDFDITLLFALLRDICNLTAPTKGWNEVPDVADESLQADLVRIKYYRNDVYAHGKGGMQVSADKFNHLWIVIRCALLRIVSKIDVHKRVSWKVQIDSLLREPLQPRDSLDVLVQQLIEWQEAEMRQLSRSISNLEQNTQSLHISVQDNSKKIEEEHSKTRQSLEKGLETIQDTVQQLVARAPTRSAPGSGVSAAQMGPVHQGNITVNTFNMYTNQTTNKQNLTTSSPALYDANELPGAPFAGGWNSGNASPPMKSADSDGSPFSGHYSGPDFQENDRRSVTPSGSVNERFFPNNVTGQILPSSGSEPFPLPETSISLTSGSSVDNSGPWGAKPSYASTPNLSRNENVPNTHFGSTNPAFLPCNPADGTSFSNWGFSANRSPPTCSPILGQSGTSPTHTQPWSAGDNSALVPIDSASGGARPKTRPYTPNSSGSPTYYQSDTTGHAKTSPSRSLRNMYSSHHSPTWQERDSSHEGARRWSNDDIRSPASGGDLSHSTPQRYCGLPPPSVPSYSADSIQSQDQYSAARVQPSIPSNSERGCSASNDSIPQDAEECGRGDMSIIIRCEDVAADVANKAIEKIAKAHIRRSTQQRPKSQFQSYLEDNKNLVVRDWQVSGNQCTILVQPLLLKALEELWKEYKSGDLRVIVQESLATPEVLQGITDCPCLQVAINEEEYNLCYFTLSSQGQTRISHTSSFDGGAPVESSIRPRPAKSMPELTSEPNEEMVNAIMSINFCKKVLDSRCSRSNCPDLHLCPFHLLDKCERTSSDCKRSHDPNDRHTIRVLGNSLPLDQLSKKQRLCLLKKLAQDKISEWKTPCNTVTKVCSFYGKGTCRNGDSCTFLHVCLYWVHDLCIYADRCRIAHDFESQQNRGILERDGINGLREHVILEHLQEVNPIKGSSATKR